MIEQQRSDFAVENGFLLLSLGLLGRALAFRDFVERQCVRPLAAAEMRNSAEVNRPDEVTLCVLGLLHLSELVGATAARHAAPLAEPSRAPRAPLPPLLR